MKRTVLRSAFLAVVVSAKLGFAQTSQGLPPGHPPIQAPSVAASALPKPTSAPASSASDQSPTAKAPGPASAASAQSASAAAGHPTPQAGAPQNPHVATGAGSIPEDESNPAPDLPKGSIEAFLVDGSNAPIGGADVRLGIMFQRISEGESRTERFLRTDAAGRVRFDGLNFGSDYSYRVTTRSGAAEYASFPFNLGEQGQRVRLHVLPVTRNIDAALIGMRSFVYIEPRDDVFVFEVLYRVFNVGTVTWVPDNVVLHLPTGFKAFNAQRGMTDVAFEAVEGEGARLKGTFTPGQHDINARFQVPKNSESVAAFQMGTLPRVAELRVIAEASSQMSLEVAGFEAVQVASNQQGKRVLVTRRVLERGDELANGFNIVLSGLPVPGSGRWVAVLLAAGLAGCGLLAARGLMRLDPGDPGGEDLVSARDLLLSELVEVERARQEGALGPRAYADARRSLLNALARLGREVLAPPRPSKRRRATA